ncbi:MAG TPA: PEP-CTERM sorting domain-containing protein [Phycisphaerae bacterium]|nr:PEP-CTERM sorting domain-containing protein [Phycisphaerae bacterium]
MTRARNYLTLVAVTVASIAVAATPAAASVTLSDANSVTLFDLGLPSGLSSWLVDGREHIGQQWFWYRVGGTGPETSIDSLTLDASILSDLNNDNFDDTLYARYLGTGLTVELWFILAGGAPGSGASDLGEIIRITNTGNEALDFHFFQYADFDLTDDNDTIEITGGTGVMAGNTAHQTSPGACVAETVVTPRPNQHQVGLDGDILGLLDDTEATTLTGTSGPVTGDASWAFQWDKVLPPGQTLLISKDKNIAPEPATLALMASGVAAALVVRRRRGK